MVQEFIVSAADGYPLSVTLFEAESSNNRLLIINSATGVKKQVYYAFAEYLSSQGFTVITYDYRGIGQSKPPKMRGFKATMRDWGSKDFKALTVFIKENYPDYQKFMLGHSVGALILGLNENSGIFHKLIFVATQNAYLRHLTWPIRIFGFIGFGVLQPVSTRLLGYFPAHFFNLGESLPAGCAYDWRTLILNPKSTTALLHKHGASHHERLEQPVLVLSAEDDTWITAKGIQSLLRDTYPGLNAVHREIKVAESEAGEIGHINFFRSYNKNLWQLVATELLNHE